jgi:hypothetical protein
MPTNITPKTTAVVIVYSAKFTNLEILTASGDKSSVVVVIAIADVARTFSSLDDDDDDDDVGGGGGGSTTTERPPPPAPTPPAASGEEYDDDDAGGISSIDIIIVDILFERVTNGPPDYSPLGSWVGILLLVDVVI